MPYPQFTPVGRYVDFSPSTFIIPKMYWDAFSLEQRYHALCKTLSKLITYADLLGLNVGDLGELYETLANDFEAFKEHGFDDYYRDLISQWVSDNMGDIIQTYVKQVFFGLSLEGNFVAYIPQGSAWDDIVFDTGQVYELDTYGRLMLFYETDASSNVWQDVSMVNDLQAILDNLDARITANEEELYPLLDESEVDDD